MDASQTPVSWGPPLASSGAGEERPDGRIGHYRLLQQIGEGGFGTVWMARQEEPIRRNVAVKILKAGMDTRQVVARFEAERQALALMDHPGIARVLDAGATPEGRPFFVMELVKGVPITRYCDEAQLTTLERIELFRSVCGAVQHAHQKGIIHRDLKPSNVLVAAADGAASPKVIDFGIAKAIAAPLTERTMYTELGQMLGTPEYMAPEQAETSGLDVDTRADIYSLGVVLYEILTGTKPFDLWSVAGRGQDEVLRTIREVDPPKPSTRVSTLGERATPIARQRRSVPKQLGRSLQGDLDWVVMKALEKERSRRYDTAAAFADDLDRYLENRPVTARPPSTAHRIAKYVRRHRIGVAAAAAIFVSLVVGLVATTSGFVEAKRQRDLAEEARTRSTKEAARAQQVVEILNTMLGGADPYGAQVTDITLRQFLDDFDAKLDAGIGAEPEVEATVRSIVGRAYRGLGQNEASKKHLLAAFELRNRALGAENVETLESRLDSALVPYDAGDYATAEREVRAGLEIVRRVAPDGTLLASYLYILGTVLQTGGGPNAGEAQAVLRESLALRERLLGPDDHRTGDTMFALGCALRDGTKEDQAEADKILRKRLEILRRTRGPDDPNAAMTLDNLARLAMERGDVTEAEGFLREAVDLQRRRLGNEHPDLATTLCTLGGLRRDAGAFDDAEGLLEEAASIYRKRLGDDHPDLAIALENRGVVCNIRGEYARAESLLAESCGILRKRMGSDHPDFLIALQQLGNSVAGQKKFADAERAYRELLETQSRRLAPDSSEVINASVSLASSLSERAYAENRPESAKESESILREILEIRRRALAPTDWRVANLEVHLAFALAAQGANLAEARALASGGCSRFRVPDTFHSLSRARLRRETLDRVVRVFETSERLEPGSTDPDALAGWKAELAELRP